MERICAGCGSELTENATVCENCGSVVSGAPQTKPDNSFFGRNKRLLTGIGGLALAVILLLVIIDPLNSPTAVFNGYLGCMRAENSEKYAAISYAANFSTAMTAGEALAAYADRMIAVAENANADIRITGVKTPRRSEIATRRAALAAQYRDTARITDVCNISFEIRQGELVTYGTAEAICVTGKWYIGTVTGV